MEETCQSNTLDWSSPVILYSLLGDDPCKYGLLQLSWQNYRNDIHNLFKALLK